MTFKHYNDTKILQVTNIHNVSQKSVSSDAQPVFSLIC